MAKGRGSVLTKHLVQRWDLDKTYLVTDTESLRGLLRIPFERARDKRALPGVAVLIKELRRSAGERGSTTSVNFVTASPPQIGRAIREKLLLDGIEIDEIRFKNQMHHLMRGHFDALREHVGYKLAELLQSARAGRRDGVELLFGDDWESDPLIYSLYADVVTGAIDWPRLETLLGRAGVQESGYLHSIRESAPASGPRRTVDAICILRARPRASTEFTPFGPRLFWFDSYLECAMILYALGYLDVRGIIEVASASEANDEAVTSAFEAATSRWPRLRREHLTIARRALVEAQLMQDVPAGSWWLRARTHWRVMRKLSPLPPLAGEAAMPDYDDLVQSWGHRARKEKEKEKEVVVPYVQQ